MRALLLRLKKVQIHRSKMKSALAFIADCHNLPFLFLQLQNFMAQSTFWEATSCAATHEIPHLVWILTAHFRVYYSLPLVNVVHGISITHPVFFYFKPILMSFHLHLRFPKDFLLPFPFNLKFVCFNLFSISWFTLHPPYPLAFGYAAVLVEE